MRAAASVWRLLLLLHIFIPLHLHATLHVLLAYRLHRRVPPWLATLGAVIVM